MFPGRREKVGVRFCFKKSEKTKLDVKELFVYFSSNWTYLISKFATSCLILGGGIFNIIFCVHKVSAKIETSHENQEKDLWQIGIEKAVHQMKTVDLVNTCIASSQTTFQVRT